MEFVEFLEQCLSYLPAEYEDVAARIGAVIPTIILCVALATCFFGHTLHQLWNAFLFFGMGFLVGAMSGLFFPSSWSIYLFIALGLVLGVLAAWFSPRLYRLQLFVLNWYMAFAVLPGFLGKLMPAAPALLVGLLLSVAVGLAAAKFKYIVTMITTAVHGAFVFVPMAFRLTGLSNQLAVYATVAVLAVAGFIVQSLMEKRAHAKEHARAEPEQAARKTTEK